MSIEKLETGYWQDLDRPEKVLKLFDSGLYADCKFVVGPDDATAEAIIGHKFMFILESPVLERMFTGGFVEAGKKQEIRIVDIQPHDFKNFRYMVYNNDISNIGKYTFEEIMDLYRICDKYMVSSISRDCISVIKSSLKNVHIDRLILLYEFANGLEEKSLKIEIEKEISSRTETPLVEKLNELSADTFYNYIVFVISLKMLSSLSIFKAINSYFRRNRLMEQANGENSDKKMEYMEMDNKKITDKEDYQNKNAETIVKFKKKLLQLVNFNTMIPKDFIEGPGKSDLLEVKEKYDILSKLVLGRFSSSQKGQHQ